MWLVVSIHTVHSHYHPQQNSIWCHANHTLCCPVAQYFVSSRQSVITCWYSVVEMSVIFAIIDFRCHSLGLCYSNLTHQFVHHGWITDQYSEKKSVKLILWLQCLTPAYNVGAGLDQRLSSSGPKHECRMSFAVFNVHCTAWYKTQKHLVNIHLLAC